MNYTFYPRSLLWRKEKTVFYHFSNCEWAFGWSNQNVWWRCVDGWEFKKYWKWNKMKRNEYLISQQIESNRNYVKKNTLVCSCMNVGRMHFNIWTSVAIENYCCIKCWHAFKYWYGLHVLTHTVEMCIYRNENHIRN